MIHRGMEVPGVTLEPNIVFLTQEATPLFRYSVWKAGNLATPDRFDTTGISSLNLSNDFLADPELSPDGTLVVYSRVGKNLTPKQQTIWTVDWADTTATQIYTESSGAQNSLQPSWNPAGTKIVFRAKGTGTSQSLVKSMNSDGTGVTTLYTSATSTNEVFAPLYNHDGTLIAFVEGTTSQALSIHVMNSDGTGHSAIYTAGGTAFINPYAAWANASNVLAYTQRPDVGFTQDFLWKTINSDGTGDTTILTINRSVGYGPSDIDPYPIKWTWLPDDSAVVTSRENPAAAQPKWTLTKILASGGGYVDFSPTEGLYLGTPDGRPVVIGTRIYFPDTNANQTVLSSIKFDGSDYRTDFDGTTVLSGSPVVTFQGFKGDTINV